MGYEQQNLEKIPSDFKWSGHRLAHKCADGWLRASHKRKMILIEAPIGTFLFYYKNIKEEILHKLLLEEYGVSKKPVSNHHGQETGLKRDFDSSREKWTFGSRSLLCQRFRRRCEEMAWKRKRRQTSPVVVIVMLSMLTYIVSYKLFWN